MNGSISLLNFRRPRLVAELEEAEEALETGRYEAPDVEAIDILREEQNYAKKELRENDLAIIRAAKKEGLL